MVSTVRALCLGNEILADDAFGKVVGQRLSRDIPGLEVVESSASGFDLIDYLQNVCCLLVVDTVQTGRAGPGTIHILQDGDVESSAGCSPHYVGLFETLRLARELRLPVAKQVVILAVEAADCTTLGGPMHPAVNEAVPIVVERIYQLANAANLAHQ